MSSICTYKVKVIVTDREREDFGKKFIVTMSAMSLDSLYEKMKQYYPDCSIYMVTQERA